MTPEQRIRLDLATQAQTREKEALRETAAASFRALLAKAISGNAGIAPEAVQRFLERFESARTESPMTEEEPK